MGKYITKWDEVPLFVDTFYVSELLKVSHALVCKMCRSGQLSACKVGKDWRIGKKT